MNASGLGSRNVAGKRLSSTGTEALSTGSVGGRPLSRGAGDRPLRRNGSATNERPTSTQGGAPTGKSATASAPFRLNGRNISSKLSPDSIDVSQGLGLSNFWGDLQTSPVTVTAVGSKDSAGKDVAGYASGLASFASQKSDVVKVGNGKIKAATGREDERFNFLLRHADVKRIEGQDKMIFAELPHLPGVLVVYRSPDERESSPERLNLDRRRLAQCPLLEGEERLRLLNYQNNCISKIENLVSLPNLIFLDLYSNQVKEICNLHTVRSLRVLMLGKNQVSKIQNLECLVKLDVLDLHSNQIERVENLGGLPELRVLNLAGNHIKEVKDIDGLGALTELNLRRNEISCVSGLATLACLERVFISHNKISEIGNIEYLGKLKRLSELALDGNPVCGCEEYRDFLISKCKSLRHLDLKRVTDEEKKDITNRIQGCKPEVDSGLPLSRPESRHAQRQASPDFDDASSTHEGPSADSRGGSATPSSASRRSEARGSAADRPQGRQPKVPSRHDVLNEIRQQWLQAVSERRTPTTRYGYVKREESYELFVYGRGLDALDKPEYQTSVTSIHFHFATIEAILNHMRRLLKFQGLNSLTFGRNQIFNLAQLRPLRQIPALTQLSIFDNPICEARSMLRLNVLHLFPGLERFNGRPVTNSERHKVAGIFSPLDHVSSIENPLLPAGYGGMRGERLSRSDTETQLQPIVENLLHHAVAVDGRIRAVHQHYESAVRAIIWEACNDVLEDECFVLDMLDS